MKISSVVKSEKIYERDSSDFTSRGIPLTKVRDVITKVIADKHNDKAFYQTFNGKINVYVYTQYLSEQSYIKADVVSALNDLIVIPESNGQQPSGFKLPEAPATSDSKAKDVIQKLQSGVQNFQVGQNSYIGGAPKEDVGSYYTFTTNLFFNFAQTASQHASVTVRDLLIFHHSQEFLKKLQGTFWVPGITLFWENKQSQASMFYANDKLLSKYLVSIGRSRSDAEITGIIETFESLYDSSIVKLETEIKIMTSNSQFSAWMGKATKEEVDSQKDKLGEAKVKDYASKPNSPLRFLDVSSLSQKDMKAISDNLFKFEEVVKKRDKTLTGDISTFPQATQLDIVRTIIAKTGVVPGFRPTLFDDLSILAKANKARESDLRKKAEKEGFTFAPGRNSSQSYENLIRSNGDVFKVNKFLTSSLYDFDNFKDVDQTPASVFDQYQNDNRSETEMSLTIGYYILMDIIQEMKEEPIYTPVSDPTISEKKNARYRSDVAKITEGLIDSNQGTLAHFVSSYISFLGVDGFKKRFPTLQEFEKSSTYDIVKHALSNTVHSLLRKK